MCEQNTLYYSDINLLSSNLLPSSNLLLSCNLLLSSN